MLYHRNLIARISTVVPSNTLMCILMCHFTFPISWLRTDGLFMGVALSCIHEKDMEWSQSLRHNNLKIIVVPLYTRNRSFVQSQKCLLKRAVPWTQMRAYVGQDNICHPRGNIKDNQRSLVSGCCGNHLTAVCVALSIPCATVFRINIVNRITNQPHAELEREEV